MVMGWIETRQSGCGHYALGTASIEALEREHDERKRSNEILHKTVAFLPRRNATAKIAIHRKFQTRRVAEDSTQLYGEATQHSMRLSVDGYNRIYAGK